jgi:hypothetical protein
MMSEKTVELNVDALDAATGGDISDMSQLESMRLQNVMDRRSKFVEVLSNIMKSIGDTANQITGNLK